MMASRRWEGFRGLGVVAAIGAMLLVAACGSSSSNNSSAAKAPAAQGYGGGASSSAAPATNASLMIKTAKGSGGMYLTGSSGRAVYLWTADSGGKSNCAGACAKAWPPVIVTSTPGAGSGVVAGDLSTITRTNGAKQVTYKGHPLYYFAFDTHAGMTHGEGSNGFGAKWWLVAPSGTAIMTKASASGSGNASSSSSGSGGWG